MVRCPIWQRNAGAHITVMPTIDCRVTLTDHYRCNIVPTEARGVKNSLTPVETRN
jgi:hypothetical protein